MTKVNIKRFDKQIPLPAYKTPGAAGMDIYTREDTTIEAKSIGYIPLNIALEIPQGCWAMIAPRSSTHKQGLMMANSIGIGDADFNGNNDEYVMIAYNFTDSDVVVEKGSRIAQLMVMDYVRVELNEVDALQNKDRGGLGSTGLKG